MVDDPQQLEDLAAHAHEAHVVVVGGGIAGLVAALECAKVGVRVTVLEASDRLGGLVRAADLAGLTLDVGAESFATRGGHVRALVEEVRLGDDIVTPAPAGAWIAGLPGAAPLPKGGVLGIPASPFAEDVRAVIGWNGAWRAYLDRLRPVLTIGQERSLGRLVRGRMGERVLERLVAPVTSGVYSADPDDIDVELAAPGLSAALTRAGSLSGAVLQLARARTEAPGSAVEGVRGGMSRLVDALAARLADFGVEIRLDTPVEAIEGVSDAAKDSPRWRIRTAEGDLSSDQVVVAASESAARALLRPLIGLADRPGPAPRVHIVTLVLDSPELDAAPRGSGVLTVPGTHRAKALTHATAKWAWLSEIVRAQHPHRHVVRVSFGSQAEPPATDGLDLEAATAMAVTEAATLLGVALDGSQVVGSDIARYEQTLPGAAIGQRDAAAAVRARLAELTGIVAVGAWLSGTGLAQVVPDARAQALAVRRAALFGAPPTAD
ncbi:protoporphyrinogen oxidase [Microbacterium deminutum]|uniref:Coproporphyrinogen III oxidase n=1 Tax=Microbacterium deminutum TaxID=344164 RepID=A0ABN2QQG6_9MICO